MRQSEVSYQRFSQKTPSHDMKVLFKLMGLNSDYELLFFKNEYRTLSGKNKRIIFFLITILFLTFLALGYSIGSVQYLRKKMSNPYTNWVDLSVSHSMGITDKIALDIKNSYPEAKKALFHINDIRGSVTFRPSFYKQSFSPVAHPRDTLDRNLRAITIAPDDLLFEKIISTENLVWLKPGVEYGCEECISNCQIIITETVLTNLGFKANDPNIGHLLINDDRGIVPIEVIAVVQELPKFSHIVCAPELFNINDTGPCEDLIRWNGEGDNSIQFIIDGQVDLKELEELSFKYFQSELEIDLGDKIVSGPNSWQTCIFYFRSQAPDIDQINDFIEFTRTNGFQLGAYAEYQCDTHRCTELETIHNIAFNFSDLNEIRNFKDDMAEDNIEIDMRQIEVKENFALVSSLTWTISIILLIFGILSIILFVNNMLRTHLFKVRTNLGTFKAFGLSNKFLNTIYLKIITSFLVIAIGNAFILACIVDRIEHALTIESKFNIFSPWVLISVIGLLVISLYISSRTSRKILGDTPGNLIYNR